LALQIAAIGLLFGLLFEAELSEYMPFLASSLVLWNLILNSMNDSAIAYLQSERIIRQVRTPPSLPIVRVFGKNLIVFLHNSLILIVVALIFGIWPGWYLLLSLFGLLLLAGNLAWIGTIIGIVSARYRDFPPIITTALTLSFYVTPVLWQPERLPESFRQVVVTYNPLYHLMEIVRAPLFGQVPDATSWAVAVVMIAIGGTVARFVSKRFGWRIAYWL
jgi:ABC-type polysaccharide/polyol phosphate export permease